MPREGKGRERKGKEKKGKGKEKKGKEGKGREREVKGGPPPFPGRGGGSPALKGGTPPPGPTTPLTRPLWEELSSFRAFFAPEKCQSSDAESM